MNEDLRPAIAPSQEEQLAVAEVSRSVDRYVRRVLDEHAQPQLTFSDAEHSSAPPEWLRRQIETQQLQLLSEIDRLSEPEGKA